MPVSGDAGMTLVETAVSLGIAGILITAIVSGFIQAHRQSEWSAYSLAANSLAMQGVEQARAAKWDRLGYPPVDQVVTQNFPRRIEVLDIPIVRSNIVYATNRWFISSVSTNPPLRLVRVECSWRFPNRGVFTNSVATYRAPDQ